jgi:hypothetical protein
VFAALVAPLFVLALPILDMTLAILRRGLRGLPIFRPDRKHIHHRLLGMGLSQRRAVLSLYAVTLVFLVMGFVAYASRGQSIPILLGITVIIVLVSAGKLSFSREWFAVGRILGNSLEMRQEVQYALTLSRWLALEGPRCMSVEELWSNLVFAGQRLGFSYIALTLADGQRVWGHAQDGAPSHSARHELQNGRLGILELKAPVCAFGKPDASSPFPPTSRCERPCCPCASEETLFAILSDLLAEGWTKAGMKWNARESAPLRFDGRTTRSSSYPRFGVPRAVPSTQLATVAKPIRPALKDAERQTRTRA